MSHIQKPVNPKITAPAVIGAGIPSPSPILIIAIPAVPAVPHEVPAAREVILDKMRAANKKMDVRVSYQNENPTT